MSLHGLDATRGEQFQTTLTVRQHVFRADEPVTAGGTDTAPTPVELLLGSLAACTAITLRMYAQRKQWPLESVDVQVQYTARPAPSIVKVITPQGALDETPKARLLEIAEACPVAKLLRSGVTSESRLGPVDEVASS